MQGGWGHAVRVCESCAVWCMQGMVVVGVIAIRIGVDIVAVTLVVPVKAMRVAVMEIGFTTINVMHETEKVVVVVRAERVVAPLVVEAERMAVVVAAMRMAVVVAAMRVMVVGGTAVRSHVEVPHTV